MSAEASETTAPLTKVDSAVQGVETKKGHRRNSSSVADVYNIADLGE